jgi:uncharacterized heparinase superfamily protein
MFRQACRTGATRFKARIALAMASLCLPSSSGTIRAAARNLDHEFNAPGASRWVHVSRNPMVLIELLMDLLPLRQTYVNVGQKPPHNMAAGMDRLFCGPAFLPAHQWRAGAVQWGFCCFCGPAAGCAAL